MINLWKNLSVAKKLYAVVGLMALLIAGELATLSFAMDILSSVRAFVEGEGIWSKSQKNAILSLYRYASTGDEAHYKEFNRQLSVPLGDRRARLELLKINANMDEIRAGFLQGHIHENDIPGLVRLIQRFHRVSYVAEALEVWANADELLSEVMQLAPVLKKQLALHGPKSPEVASLIRTVDKINNDLTTLEIQFSSTLSEGSRWLEDMLMYLLVIAVLCVECTGLFLTFLFARNLNRSLKEIIDVTTEVGKGNLNVEAPVRSMDELGKLALAVNKMTDDLKTTVGERKKAENASHVKTVFVANMSHEIRTPLGAIMGLAELLKDPAITEDERIRYVDTISQTGQHLTRIINDILDISRVESGHLEIEKSIFSLDDFMKELQQTLSVQASRRKNKLVFTKIGKAPALIKTDKVRLRQIIINVCSNALKFTDSGKVAVDYWEEYGKLRVRITDTGIGIRQEEYDRLFKLFSQGAHPSSRPNDGSGLGLALAKRLANALGGDVVLISSQVGTGSVFEISLHAEEVRLEEMRGQDSKTLDVMRASLETIAGRKILVVDDSSENQMLLNAVLLRKGAVVSCASNGLEGVNQALSADPDIILMDIQMPVMDGYTAMRELRKQGFTKPIVALTAHAMVEDKERCFAAGCSAYLTKPINFQLLLSTISGYVNQPYVYDAHVFPNLSH